MHFAHKNVDLAPFRTAKTIPEVFLKRVETTPKNIAYKYFVTETASWEELTWEETSEKAALLANGLLKLGLAPNSRVAIISSTRIEWILSDLAILWAGLVTTAIYPSSPDNEILHILKDSEAQVAFVENADQVNKLANLKAELPQLKYIIQLTTKEPSTESFIFSLEQLATAGALYQKTHQDALTKRLKEIKADDLATLLYTSGTTGLPKGVELTHACWTYECLALIDHGFSFGHEVEHYLWLPLAHSFGKLLITVNLYLNFINLVDGDLNHLASNIALLKPTLLTGVPRVFEKIYNKIIYQVENSSRLQQKIFNYALNIGYQVSRLSQQQKPLPWLLKLKNYLATHLVFNKIRQRFGGRLKICISGGAPLAKHIAEFFHALGILILEGYGLTETSAATLVNTPQAFRFGTVGKPIPGTEIRLDPLDNEILLKGGGIMRNYHNLAGGDVEHSRKAFTADGWLRTGDIGYLDAEGFLSITDRKKDLFKTSGGKYIAPQHLENKLKTICPYINQVIIHGEARNFCTALVTLDQESIQKWAKKQDIEHESYSDLTNHPQTLTLIEKAVATLNENVASYETIKKIAILPQDFTIEAAELTPNLKMKRKLIEHKYKHILDSFYENQLKTSALN